MMKNPKFVISAGLITVFYIAVSLQWVDIGSPKQWIGLLLFGAVAFWRLFRHNKKSDNDADRSKEARIEAAERVLGRGRLVWEWLGVVLTVAGVAWGAMDMMADKPDSKGFVVSSLLALGGMVYSGVIDVLIDDELKKTKK